MKKIVGIFCETPFQFIAGLNVAINYLKADQCVIFPVKEMYLSSRTFNIIKQKPIISAVYNVRRYPIDFKDFSLLKRVFLKLILRKKYYLFRNFEKCPPFIDYYAFVGTKYSGLSEYVASFYSISVPFYLIEEGIGDFHVPIVNGMIATCNSNVFKHLSSIMHVCILPELLKSKYPQETIVQAPYIVKGDRVSRIIEKQFLTTNIQMPKNSVIYFHQPNDSMKLKNKNDNSFFDSYEEKLFIEIESVFPNVLIKMHPRDEKSLVSKYKIFDIDAPWEAFPNNQDVNDFLLISTNSTALLTAKLLYNQEPFILVLDGLFGTNNKSNSKSNDDIVQMFFELKNKYKNKDRVQIPMNESELKKSLTYIKNNMK